MERARLQLSNGSEDAMCVLSEQVSTRVAGDERTYSQQTCNSSCVVPSSRILDLCWSLRSRTGASLADTSS
jgi:hypothetical protein